MAITKTVANDLISILEGGQLQVRTATIYKDGGTEVSRTFHRHVLEPGDSLDGEDDRVAAVAAATWTTDVVAAWDAFVAERDAHVAS
jgi:hypothetical protein